MQSHEQSPGRPKDLVSKGRRRLGSKKVCSFPVLHWMLQHFLEDQWDSKGPDLAANCSLRGSEVDLEDEV